MMSHLANNLPGIATNAHSEFAIFGARRKAPQRESYRLAKIHWENSNDARKIPAGLTVRNDPRQAR